MSKEKFPLESVIAGVDFLQEAALSPDRAEELRRNLQQVSSPDPQTKIRVVRKHDSGTGQDDWVVLLQHAELGTLLMTLGPRRPGVWMVHDAPHVFSNNLVLVDGEPVTFNTLVGLLEFVWSDQSLIKQILRQGIFYRELGRLQLSVSDQEIQEAVDAWRRQTGLHGAREMRQWMEENMVPEYKLRLIGRDLALRRKLELSLVPDQEVDKYLNEIGPITKTWACKAVFVRREAAEEMQSKRPDNLESWIADAMAIRDFDFLERLRLRDDLSGPYQSVVEAGVGSVVGPFREFRGWSSIYVDRRDECAPTPQEYEETRRLLFNRLVDEQVKQADIQWLWGDVNRFQNRDSRKGAGRD
ncbi:MAG TPA: hypothetical protein VJ302_28900 [Blastocatellia bacterium]|nr:hypothetical protein [Blastocatellia bacterium]